MKGKKVTSAKVNEKVGSANFSQILFHEKEILTYAPNEHVFGFACQLQD